MKLTLLLLWSLGSASLHDACTSCQQTGPVVGDSYQSGLHGPAGIGGSNTQFNEFTSPCGDCNACNGDGLGRCNRRGRCKSCCKDSTCNMYLHFPYEPDNHGLYYFAPYNYTMVWKHQQWITTIGGDPRNPYGRAMFTPVYEQFENTVYEPDLKPSQTLSTLPAVSRKLPELESLMRRPDGAIPTPVPTAEPTPAAPAPATDNVTVPEPESDK